ncbi:MAG: hypothetical protein ABIH39_05805 [Candidatus Margulisiibacteriota bacterium]
MKKAGLILIICSLVAAFTIYAGAATEVTLNIITAPEVPEYSIQDMINRISSIRAYQFNVAYLQYSKEKYPEITVLPAYFFSKELVNEPQSFSVLAGSRMITENWKAFKCLTYQIPPNTYECGVYINNKTEKGKMDLFYRPFCPYGMKALIALLEYHQKEPRIISELNIVPLLKETDTGFTSNKDSLHQRYQMPGGFMELRETIRQLVIHEYMPDKLLEYIKYRQKNSIESPYWEKAVLKVGIKPETVSELYETRGETLLDRAMEARSKYQNISASPTYLWKNKYRYNYTSELLQQPAFKDIKIEIGNSKCR